MALLRLLEPESVAPSEPQDLFT